jgi:hypothetical protein
MQNILNAFDALKNDAERLLKEALATIPDPNKIKQVIEVLPQFTGMQSTELENIKNHPLIELIAGFADSENARSKSFFLASLFGVTEAYKIEFTNPKIHPGLKSFANFEAIMNGKKGYMITVFDTRKMELQQIKNNYDNKDNKDYKSTPILSYDYLQSVFFIPKEGFGPIDLTSANVFDNMKDSSKNIFDNF